MEYHLHVFLNSDWDQLGSCTFYLEKPFLVSDEGLVAGVWENAIALKTLTSYQIQVTQVSIMLDRGFEPKPPW